MIRLYLTFALALCAGFLFDAAAQRPTDDVLYLKNGWVLRGKLLPAAAPESVSIQTNDGNTFVFPQTDVLETKKEPALRYLNIRYRDRGYAHFTEMGVMASSNNVNELGVTTSAFTFHTVNGYKFNQWFYTGLGAGVDLYASQTFIPVFASARGDFTRRGILIPYYYIDGGWGFNGTTNLPGKRQRGGAHFAAGLGMKVLFNGNAGFLLSVGYYLQQTAIEETHDSGIRRTETDYQRVAIRAGFAF
ncbi:MAG: hypothetical protein MUD08_08920 [Cytophagales bacterium]|jgi:hypothetical protein|nr:hypothetical protein [Cytophagales bacterium]